MKEAKVKSYTRKTKSGKTIQVRAHSRKCEGGSCADKQGSGDEIYRIKKLHKAGFGYAAEDLAKKHGLKVYGKGGVVGEEKPQDNKKVVDELLSKTRIKNPPKSSYNSMAKKMGLKLTSQMHKRAKEIYKTGKSIKVAIKRAHSELSTDR